MIPTDDHQNTRLGTPASCVDLICRLRRLTLQATRLQIPYSSCPLRLSHGQPSPVRTPIEVRKSLQRKISSVRQPSTERFRQVIELVARSSIPNRSNFLLRN